ncbi:MAG: hypothetical protein Ct9H300mP14_09140 [Gammaproteobacteria bacterium]|nr:MAG: hypothetical protein Ct9H300mP14_09140 [Gammaproteobacteria bacterium]
MQTYRGSCHCGTVVFEIEAEIDHVPFATARFAARKAFCISPPGRTLHAYRR